MPTTCETFLIKKLQGCQDVGEVKLQGSSGDQRLDARILCEGNKSKECEFEVCTDEINGGLLTLKVDGSPHAGFELLHSGAVLTSDGCESAKEEEMPVVMKKLRGNPSSEKIVWTPACHCEDYSKPIDFVVSHLFSEEAVQIEAKQTIASNGGIWVAFMTAFALFGIILCVQKKTAVKQSQPQSVTIAPREQESAIQLGKGPSLDTSGRSTINPAFLPLAPETVPKPRSSPEGKGKLISVHSQSQQFKKNFERLDSLVSLPKKPFAKPLLITEARAKEIIAKICETLVKRTQQDPEEEDSGISLEDFFLQLVNGLNYYVDCVHDFGPVSMSEWDQMPCDGCDI